MADAATFDIAIEATSLGVDASAGAVSELAARIQRTNDVAHQFDSAILAARRRLDETTTAATLAAEALSVAEKRYGELENAANKAAKELEKAKLAGKDTSALQAAAAGATAAMVEQAATVDDLRAKTLAATAAQTKLSSALAVLQQQSKKQVAVNKALMEADKRARLGVSAEAERLNERRLENKSKLTEKWTGRLGTLRTASLAAGAAFGVAAIGAVAFAVAQDPVAMERLGAAASKAKTSFAALFKGLKLGPFIDGLTDIMSLFDEGTSSASGLKLLIETIFQPIFDAGAKLAPFVKELFKGLVLGALIVTVEILRLRNAILKMIPEETRAAIKSFVDQHLTLENAGKAGAVVFVLLTAALTAFAIAAIAAAWPILAIVAAVALVVAAFVYWEEILQSLSDAWWDLDKQLRDAVKNVITGIVNGIKNGAGAVYDAMANMASGAITAFKNKLGIKSPSAVFALQANYTTQGYIEGIEAGAPKVNEALGDMVDPTATAVDLAAPVPAASSPAPRSGGGNVITIQSLVIGDSPVAQENFAAFKRAVAEMLEGAVISIGGAEAPAS
jgi:hypothetical protein